MATLTKEQVEQKMKQLQQLSEEMSALAKELVEAGAIELSDEDLEKVDGGRYDMRIDPVQKPKRRVEEIKSGPDLTRNPFNPIK